MPKTLAHLSDLHLDTTPESDAAAMALVEGLLAERVDHVVVTGDVTHQGRRDEERRFFQLFAPLWETGRLTLLPGNHDRLGDEVGVGWMEGRKVRVESRPGLHLVCVDSTGPHNRSWLESQGELTPEVVEQVEAAVARAPAAALVAVLLHHHVLPLPEDSLAERWSQWMGWPYTAELGLGAELVRRLHGRCDLILHGHRHVPRELGMNEPGERSLRIYNAGSTTGLGRFRVFKHEEGRLVGPAEWRRAERPTVRWWERPGRMVPVLQSLALQLGSVLQ